MYVAVTTSPVDYPVSVAEIKSHAVIDHTDDDTLIGEYLKAAIAELDPPYGYLGRAMVEQTLTMYLSEFGSGNIRLPFPPLISVESIKYQDEDGDEQTVDSSTYEVITGAEPGYIALLEDEEWPDDLDEIEYPVWITYKAGYETTVTGEGESETRTVTVPSGIRHYIMMLVAEMYKEREFTVLGTIMTQHKFWSQMIEKYRFRFGGW